MPGALDNAAAAPGPSQGEVAAVVEIPHEPYVIVEQNVELELNFREETISGTTKITLFHHSAEDADSIFIDARQSDIDTDNIIVNGKKVKATYKDPYELLDTPEGYNWTAQQHHLRADRMAPLLHIKREELPMAKREESGCMPNDKSLRIWLHPDEVETPAPKPSNRIVIKRTNTIQPKPAPEKPINANTFHITIPFRITRVRDGYHFVGVEYGDTRYPHLYTRHSIESGAASCLFPCIDDRSRLEEWKISLKFPRTVGDALMQPLVTQANTVVALVNGDRQAAKGTHRHLHRDFMTEEDKLLELTAVCSGTLIGEHIDPDDETKKVMQFQSKAVGAQHIGFAVGPFEDVDLHSSFRSEEDDETLRGNAVKIHGYCLPGRSEEVQTTCAALAMATDFFALTFVPYPFDNSWKLCFVDDMVEDTVPLHAFSMCSSRLLYDERIVDTEIDVTRKLVHSLASQYFGIFMNPNKLTDTWIIVGLAYYMTDLFLKKLVGNNYYRYQIRVSADHLVEVDHRRPSIHALGESLHLGDFEMEFMAHKAPLVIFILDRRLLKSSNTAGMTRVMSHLQRAAAQAEAGYAAPFAISSDRFRRICEKLGRLRLESFWDQWVLGAGCPRLDVAQKFNKKRLEVELTVVQDQYNWSREPHALDKGKFWRDLVEERHGLYAGTVPLTFTGPITFRVYEADGTPYEHCLEIKLDAAANKGSKLAIPYNTKYKRIKRNRQKKKDKGKQRTTTTGRDDPDRNDDEDREDDEDSTHMINSFGTVLTSDKDMDSWRLVEYDEDMQQQMDQESYEWIRVDCDFEWVSNMKTNFKVYMTVSQLQQDRDIAGQVESMLQLSRNDPSNIQTTILLRTLYDKRYYPGIRQMAANALTNHSHPKNNWRGMRHLIRVFQTFYCHPGTSTPRPNDFSDKAEYMVQCAIPGALARVRGGEDFCPKEARDFILRQLVFNKNDQNEYSDHMYVAKLLEALATSLEQDRPENGRRPAWEQDSATAAEIKAFAAKALEQIDRYCRMDDWVHSYQNIWTVTAINCKARLMKSGIIPVNALDFIIYLTHETLDLVQIKAFESLIDLGLFLKPSIMKLLFTTLSTHSSPFVRDRLFKALTRGLAAIAFGDHKVEEPARLIEAVDDDEADNGGLIVEKGEAVIQQKQAAFARKQNIEKAAHAMKEALKENKDLQWEIWKAIDSSILGLAEKRNLLDLCATLFDEDDEFLITVQYPKKWTVERGHYEKGRSCIVHFKQVCKTTSPKRKRNDDAEEVQEAILGPIQAPAPAPVPVPAPAPAPEVVDTRPPEPKRIKFSTGRASLAGKSGRSAASPAPRQPSIAVAAPPAALLRNDTIAAQGTAGKPLSGSVTPGHATPARATPARATPVPATPAHGATPEPGTTISAKPAAKLGVKSLAAQLPKAKKRKIEDGTHAPRASKIIKLRYNPDKLTAEQKGRWRTTPPVKPASSSIVATPSRVPSASSPGTVVDASFGSSTISASSQQTPGGSKPARKPLPTSAPSQSVPATDASPSSMAKSQPPQASPSVIEPATSSTLAPAPGKPKIKLKFKKREPSVSQSSHDQGSPPAASF